MKPPKIKMFKQPGSLIYLAEDFESSGKELEIFREQDKESLHHGKWVLTASGVFQDCDAYINDLAERNNLVIVNTSVNSSLIGRLKNLQRLEVIDRHGIPGVEESSTGDYVRHDDMMEIINSFQTK